MSSDELFNMFIIVTIVNFLVNGLILFIRLLFKGDDGDE